MAATAPAMSRKCKQNCIGNARDEKTQLWKIAGWLVNCLLLPNKNATTTEVYLVLPTKRHFPQFFYLRQTIVQQISCLFYIQVSRFNAF